MKVLIWSDLHLHNWSYGSTIINGMNSRLLAQAKVMSDIADHIKEVGVDRIIFLGDLFHCHGKIDASVLKVAYEGITKIMSAGTEYKMDMLVGNHDTDRKDLSVHALHWLNSIPRVRVIDRPVHHPNEFSFLPYTEDAEILKTFFAICNPICFMHQGLVDVPMGSGFVINETMNLEMIPDHVRHVFTGHYHPHVKVSEKATVVGSVMQHTWADTGDKRGFLVYDTNTKDIEQIKIRAPEFKTVDMGGAGSLGTIDDKKWFHPPYFKGNYIRVTNFDEAAIPVLRKEMLEAGALSVEFVIKPKTYKSTVVKAISGAGLSVPELVREYEKEHCVSEDRRKVGKELMK